MDAIRFATIGSSNIATRFLDALAQVDGAEYVGAYSRDAERARAFGEPHGARIFFDDLDGLASSPDIDAVYIASPNALHADQALRMMRAGKHVLCEKSLASNEREALQMFDVAHEEGVVLLEAMRNIHNPSFDAVEDALDELGDITLATFRFAKVTSRIARMRAGEKLNVFDPELSEGALMDMGVYAVEPAVALFGRPDQVAAFGLTREAIDAREPYDVIDLAGQLLLDYGDTVVNCSYGKVSDNLVDNEIEGEKATLTFSDVSVPTNLVITPHVDKGMVFSSAREEGHPIETESAANDMVYEIEDFIEAVHGDADAVADAEYFEQVTLDALWVMDEARAQMGVAFPADYQ